jgi:diguanylate cyclase (GGDEF)-like protein/PAS domain S-box-containing protein
MNLCFDKQIENICVIRRLSIYILFLLCTLFNSFAYGGTGNSDILSAAERDWLSKNQSRLVFAVETSYAPFAFVDSNGQPSGLASDYMLLLESKLGVHFPQRRFSTLADIFEKVHSGEVQIVNAVTNTPERAKFLAMTAPFISVPNVIVVKKDRPGRTSERELQGLNVSLVKSYAVTEYITKQGLQLPPDLVPDDLAALLNVAFGRTDATVIDLATASYLITNNGITNLRVAGEVAYDIHLSMATPLNEPVLHGILQKGLNAITDTERQEIKNRWINASYKPSIFKNSQFWVVLAVVFAILVIVLIWNLTLRRQVALRKQSENALRESEARFRVMLENDLVGIATVKDRIIQWANPAYERLLGYEKGELNGVQTRDIYADDEAYQALGEKYLSVINAGKVFHSEQVFIRKDGRPITVDLNGSLLNQATGESLWIYVDITERKQMEEQVRHLAFYDPLTNLPNRRLLIERLNLALLASKRTGQYGALMFLDLDNFKPLNDRFGHGVGDLLLIEVGNRLRNCVREIDTVARFGGDEFVVILSALHAGKAESKAQTQVVAEKIRTSLSASYYLHIIGEELPECPFEHHSAASIGIAMFINHEGSQEDIMKWADMAMYQAKESGRNVIRFFDQNT